jgi:hypothetical protein
MLIAFELQKEWTINERLLIALKINKAYNLYLLLLETGLNALADTSFSC